MKELFEKSSKKIKDNYYGLSEKKKVVLILLVSLFIFMLFFTINEYTDIFDRISNVDIIKDLMNYLKQIPMLLIIILFTIFTFIIHLLFFSPKSNLNLKLIDILELDKPDVSSKIFEITLANNTNERIILKTLNVNWEYVEGNCCSIGGSSAIIPIAKYIIDIPLDVDDKEKQSCNKRMTPMIEIVQKDEYGPGIVQFIIQIHYHFSGRIDYHPCSDWDIVFSLDIIDSKNRSFNIFNGYKWRCEKEIEAQNNGELEEYNKILGSRYLE